MTGSIRWDLGLRWDRDECCRQYRYNSGRHLDREAVAGWRLTEYDSAQHGIWVAEYWWIDTLPVWAMRFPGPKGRPGNSPVRKEVVQLLSCLFTGVFE